jgi:hypothetical protein
MNAIYKKISFSTNLKTDKTFIKRMAFFIYFIAKLEKEVKIKVLPLKNMLTRIILHIMK